MLNLKEWSSKAPIKPVSFYLSFNSFLIPLMLIVGSVVMWSSFYMSKEKNKVFFYLITCLFAFSMLILLIGDSLFLLFIGWEGLGLSSYMLISYYQSWGSINNGVYTFLTMRLGDAFFLLSMFFSPVLFLLLLSMTKSAMLPFTSWLPKAMAAPTPISALVHSSTLVTAGIFLLFTVELSTKILSLLAISTLILSGMLGTVEKDMKKVVALSTLSQLSFMWLLMAQSYYILAMAHLIIHAIFKSLLFLGVGSLIHSSWGEQMKSKMMKGSSLLLLMAQLSIFSLMGLPFFSGLVTKDLFITHLDYNLILFLLGISLTFLYSFNLLTSMKPTLLQESTSSIKGVVSGWVLMVLAVSMGVFLWLSEGYMSSEKSLPLLFFLALMVVIFPFKDHLAYLKGELKEGVKILESIILNHLKLWPILSISLLL